MKQGLKYNKKKIHFQFGVEHLVKNSNLITFDPHKIPTRFDFSSVKITIKVQNWILKFNVCECAHKSVYKIKTRLL